MKTLICLIAVFSIVSTGQAAVVSKIDESKSCTLFSLKHAENGGSIKLASGEKIHLEGTIYGFTFQRPKVDFDSRTVSVKAQILKWGLNKTLKENLVLDEQNVDIEKALDYVNRKVQILDEVCISSAGELIYFK